MTRMETLGQYLRQQREAQHLSVDDVASHTRIQAGFLEAIEANQFDHVPHSVSVKGFIRSYAQFLHLDTVEMFQRFSLPSPETAALKWPDFYGPSLVDMGRVGKPVSSRSFYRSMKVLLIVFVLSLLFVFFLVGLSYKNRYPFPLKTEGLIGNTSHRAASVPTALNRDPIVAPAEDPETSLPETDLAVALPPLNPTMTYTVAVKNVPPLIISSSRMKVPTIQASSVQPPVAQLLEKPLGHPSSQFFTLLLTADATTWIKVVIDDNMTRGILLNPGESIAWEAREAFRLTVGNAGGVKAFLNGKSLGVLGKSGEVIHRLLTRSTLAGVAQW